MLRAVASGGDQTVTNLDVASGGSIDLYNTSPISSTDYERLRLDWSSNIARVWTQNDGTGTARALRVGAQTTDGATSPVIYTQWQANTSPQIIHLIGGTGNAGIAHELASPVVGNFTAASGTQTAVAVSPTFAQTGTAAGIALLVNPSGTFGSGGGLLQSWQLASANRATLNTAGTFQAGSIVATGGGGLGFATSIGSTIDIVLERDAADTLALRRTTNAQTIRVYHTYTDSSNRQNAAIKTAASYVEFAAETAGTGADDIDVLFTPTGTGLVRFGTHSAVGAETVTGYITIKDAGGTSRKVAILS